MNTIKDINKLRLDEEEFVNLIGNEEEMILDKLKGRVTRSDNNSDPDLDIRAEKSSGKKKTRKISDVGRKGNTKKMFQSTGINRNPKLREELQFLNKVNRPNNSIVSKNDLWTRKTTRNRVKSFHLIRKAHTPVASKHQFDGKEILQPQKLFRSSRKESFIAKRNVSKKKEV